MTTEETQPVPTEDNLKAMIRAQAVKIRQKTLSAISKRFHQLKEDMDSTMAGYLGSTSTCNQGIPLNKKVSLNIERLASNFIEDGFNLPPEGHIDAISKGLTHKLLQRVSDDTKNATVGVPSHTQSGDLITPSLRDGKTFEPIRTPAGDSPYAPFLMGAELIKKREPAQLPRPIAIALTNRNLQAKGHDLNVSKMTTDKSWNWEKKNHKTPRNRKIHKEYIDTLDNTDSLSNRIKSLKSMLATTISYLHDPGNGPIRWNTFERSEYLDRMAHMMINLPKGPMEFSSPATLGTKSLSKPSKVSRWVIKSAENKNMSSSKGWIKLDNELMWLEECHLKYRELFQALVSWIIENRSQEWQKVLHPDLTVRDDLKGPRFYSKWGRGLKECDKYTPNGDSFPNSLPHKTHKEG